MKRTKQFYDKMPGARIGARRINAKYLVGGEEGSQERFRSDFQAVFDQLQNSTCLRFDRRPDDGTPTFRKITDACDYNHFANGAAYFDHVGWYSEAVKNWPNIDTLEECQELCFNAIKCLAVQYTSHRAECIETKTGNGADYRGCQDQTDQGHVCQNWQDAQEANTFACTQEWVTQSWERTQNGSIADFRLPQQFRIGLDLKIRGQNVKWVPQWSVSKYQLSRSTWLPDYTTSPLAIPGLAVNVLAEVVPTGGYIVDSKSTNPVAVEVIHPYGKSEDSWLLAYYDEGIRKTKIVLITFSLHESGVRVHVLGARHAVGDCTSSATRLSLGWTSAMKWLQDPQRRSIATSSGAEGLGIIGLSVALTGMIGPNQRLTPLESCSFACECFICFYSSKYEYHSNCLV